jgi:hypothetical protein
VAEFFARIVPKKSTQPGEVPNPDLDLITGELAVNTADGKIWTRHTDGTLVPLGGGGGGDGGDIGEILRRTAEFWGTQKKTTDTPGDVAGPGAWCIRTDLQGITVSEFSADGTRFNGNAYSSGDTITLTVNGIDNAFTLAADPTQVTDQLFTFTFTEDTTALNNLLNGTDLIAIGLATADAENGDILIWSDACNCWNAVPLAGMAPVTSVAGKTGDVLLTLEDVQGTDDWVDGGDWGGGMPFVDLVTDLRGRLLSLWSYGTNQNNESGNDPNNLNAPTYEEEFGDMIPYLPKVEDGTVAVWNFTDVEDQQLYLPTLTTAECNYVVPFRLTWPGVYVYASKGCWSNDRVEGIFQFETADNQVVYRLEFAYRGTYSLNMLRGTDPNSLTTSTTQGSHPNIAGDITFTPSSISYTPHATDNIILAWSDAVDMSQVDHIRILKAYTLTTDYRCSAGLMMEIREPLEPESRKAEAGFVDPPEWPLSKQD